MKHRSSMEKRFEKSRIQLAEENATTEIRAKRVIRVADFGTLASRADIERKGDEKMSNALKRKKKPSFFTKKDTRIIGRNDFESRNTERVVVKSYKDYQAIGYMVLHDLFGFGHKRVIRLEQTVNKYSEAAADDSNMRGTALAYALNSKYGVDVTAIVNRVPQSQLMKLYAWKGHCIEREAYRISSASMFNYMALTMTALKTVFKFTRNQLQAFADKFIDYIDTLANYKQFQLTVPMIAETLADEIKFMCDLEV